MNYHYQLVYDFLNQTFFIEEITNITNKGTYIEVNFNKIGFERVENHRIEILDLMGFMYSKLNKIDNDMDFYQQD